MAKSQDKDEVKVQRQIDTRLLPLLQDKVLPPTNAVNAKALRAAFDLVMPRIIEAAKLLGLKGVEALMDAANTVMESKGFASTADGQLSVSRDPGNK